MAVWRVQGIEVPAMIRKWRFGRRLARSKPMVEP